MQPRHLDFRRHVFSFNRYPNLYRRSREIFRKLKEGKNEITEDDSVRRPIYSTSANFTFPHLYPNGEKSPLDSGEYKLGCYLLKKQSLFAHKMSDVLGVIILSICLSILPSHTCFVTNPKNLPAIFYTT